ncbi:DDE-type integrase/transposase/recombinase [Aurantimonas sp. 22II-16-19i]|uniref:DDE-type integrase/transposase/recombinase n=1 Tax=Aurantimonas sp. 22II-16-19i TaxID=1317114 RepID=UPI0009F7C0BC|nr:DDE-type integrase/transposase/recombinase [Aurantimonas sp. 22II-16-19i]ORE98676.1 transposase-like protein [Aurantimonas sp. 22II-16-19i]
MKEWLTAQELAGECLPHLPSTKRGINDLAIRESWNEHPAFARPRKGRGGGTEYHIRLLPALASLEYQRRYLRLGLVDLPTAANDEDAVPASRLSARASLERDARLTIIKHFDSFRSGLRLNQQGAMQAFVDRYNARTLHIEEWVLELVETISKGSLKRWIQKHRRGAPIGVDRGLARKGTGILDTANGGAVRATILALLADNQHFTAEHIRDVVESEFGKTLTVPGKAGDKTVPLPPIRAFQRVSKELRSSQEVTLMRVQNPDRFRSTMAPRGIGTLSYVSEPNQLWQIDASPVDALCTDGRHAIYVCLDIATRRMVLSVSRTPRASAVALLIRKAILAWGVADKIKTDNGSDFTARDTQRLFTFLGIEVELSDAYTPTQKAHVERAIGDFQKDFATMLPGFVGHNVADRKAIEERRSFAARLGTSDEEAFGVALTGDELQREVDRWAALHQHEPHAGLKGQTPFAVAARSTKPPRTVNERALDLLLMTVPQGGTRRVTSSGIRVDGNHYMTPAILPGTEVLVRMDSADLGVVYAFTPDGESFLGAGICPALSGIDPAEAVRALKAMQNEITSRGAAAIKAEIRRLKKGGAWHERILGVREARAPNVVALPKRGEAHVTPQIAAALEAMDAADDRRAPVPTDPRVAEEQRRLIAEMAAADEAALWERGRERSRQREAEIEAERTAHLPETVRALPESPRAKYVRMELLRRRIEAGEQVEIEDAILLGRYQETADFKGQRDMHEAYGDEYLAL